MMNVITIFYSTENHRILIECPGILYNASHSQEIVIHGQDHDNWIVIDIENDEIGVTGLISRRIGVMQAI